MCYEFSFSFCLFFFLLLKQLSCCSTLRLFATSSEDYSVKIWNCDNQLVREMSFDESLCGVCFANSRGDILVGFQSQISLVTILNYLPLSYLKIVSKMHFDNDPFEDHVQFDDLLKFWYDPARVPRMPLETSKRRPLEPPEVKRPKKKRKVGEPAGRMKVLLSSLEDKALHTTDDLYVSCAALQEMIMFSLSQQSRSSFSFLTLFQKLFPVLFLVMQGKF